MWIELEDMMRYIPVFVTLYGKGDFADIIRVPNQFMGLPWEQRFKLIGLKRPVLS